MDEARGKISVFADLQNVSPKHIPAVLSCLTGTWTPLVRVYGAVSKRRLRFFQGSGISVVEMASSKPGRNAVDIQITADAIEELYRGDSEAFAIVSADSDYTYVVRRIRERKPVFVFGPSKTPDALKRACTEFYLLPLGGGITHPTTRQVAPGSTISNPPDRVVPPFSTDFCLMLNGRP